MYSNFITVWTTFAKRESVWKIRWVIEDYRWDSVI